jgi:uncharacterized protein HemX
VFLLYWKNHIQVSGTCNPKQIPQNAQTFRAATRLELRRVLVANDADPFEFNAVTRQALEQAHHAVDAYFDILKEIVSALPSGGTEIGERMKGEGVENITAVQALVKRLSEAKDFQEALAVQTAFIHSQLNVFAKRAASARHPLEPHKRSSTTSRSCPVAILGQLEKSN